MNTTLPQPLAALASLAGHWRGTNRLHDPHTNTPDDSPSTLTLAAVLGGRFLRLEYTWALQGKPQEGSLLLGCNGGTFTAQWADTWHNGDVVMTCAGAVDDTAIVVRGAYAAPPGPDWGWRIEIRLGEGDVLKVAMFNVTPDGQAAPAVEAAYTREPVPGNIGQIALTATSVERSLTFYRDVLGLPFLFSAGPNLAFLTAGGTRLMIAAEEGSGTTGKPTILYFKVHQVERVFEAVMQRGATAERRPQLTARMPDHELWIGFVRDPEGNIVGLMEEKRA